MKSRNYAGISLLASLAACNSATAETVQKNSTQAPQKPNVIVILADDLGYGDLKCYGAKNVETPHVDKLASEGIRFTNAHTVAATSTPIPLLLADRRICMAQTGHGYCRRRCKNDYPSRTIHHGRHV